jgi:hypothetical protein
MPRHKKFGGATVSLTLKVTPQEHAMLIETLSAHNLGRLGPPLTMSWFARDRLIAGVLLDPKCQGLAKHISEAKTTNGHHVDEVTVRSVSEPPPKALEPKPPSKVIPPSKPVPEPIVGQEHDDLTSDELDRILDKSL